MTEIKIPSQATVIMISLLCHPATTAEKSISKSCYNPSETSYSSLLDYKLLEDSDVFIFVVPSASNRNATNIC